MTIIITIISRIDDAYGSYLATKYILDCGHRAVAFFSGRIKENGVMKKRLAGYRDAWQSKSFPSERSWSLKGTLTKQRRHRVCPKAHGRGTPCHSGGSCGRYSGNRSGKSFAMSAKGALGRSSAGLSIEIAQYMTPGLTTVKQQISAKGEKAVELLIRNINEPELTKQELILPVSLVERGSVRKIKT